MEIVTRKLSELIPSEKNVRKHNRRQIEELVKAINQFGVIRPIIVDENNVILCGHGLYEALKENGNETADCKVISGLTEKQKKKLMLADNKIYDLGTSDYDTIDELLAEFGKEEDFNVPGYDTETLEELYGIKSIKKAAEQVVAVPDVPYIPQRETPPERLGDASTPTPSAHVREARAEALNQRRIIICPHCGETIEL